MSASDLKDAKLAEALAECERLREENRQLRGRLEMPFPEGVVPPRYRARLGRHGNCQV